MEKIKEIEGDAEREKEILKNQKTQAQKEVERLKSSLDLLSSKMKGNEKMHLELIKRTAEEFKLKQDKMTEKLGILKSEKSKLKDKN